MSLQTKGKVHNAILVEQVREAAILMWSVVFFWNDGANYRPKWRNVPSDLAFLLRSARQRCPGVLHPNAHWECCSVWEKVSMLLFHYQLSLVVSKLVLVIWVKLFFWRNDSNWCVTGSVVVCECMFQNVSSVAGYSSGFCSVLSALLPLLRSHGKRPVQKPHRERRVRKMTASSLNGLVV